MGKKAFKKSVEKLQQVFDFLGSNGGYVTTNSPKEWWDLDVEVGSPEDDEQYVIMNLSNNVNGDHIFDPQFELSLTWDGDKIVDIDILRYMSQSVLGIVEVDDDDILHDIASGKKEKAPQGLQRLFEDFMTSITEVGPYLSNPKSVEKHTETLD